MNVFLSDDPIILRTDSDANVDGATEREREGSQGEMQIVCIERMLETGSAFHEMNSEANKCTCDLRSFTFQFIRFNTRAQ